MNKSWRYWLFSDAIFDAFSIARKLGIEYVKRATMAPPLVCGFTSSKLEILYPKVEHEGPQNWRHFSSFAIGFDATKAHNLLALMLDLQHKDLKRIAKSWAKMLLGWWLHNTISKHYYCSTIVGSCTSKRILIYFKNIRFVN